MSTNRTLGLIALAPLAVASLSLATPMASAADLTAAASAPQAESLLTPYSPWQVRARALAVVPNDGGSVDGIGGSDLSYSNSVTPEVDFSYFFNRNIAAELILGTTSANVNAGGSIGSLGKLGKVWILPPTVTLQYHFTDFGKFQPYIGAGVNYTMFYNQSAAGSATKLDVKNTFGAAVQVGFDYMINDKWGVNFDVKKYYLRPDFEATVGGSKVKGTAKLDPWLIGAGVTYRF
ncbi:outer membrane beta-barrel protein [Agrobacterium vitis]|uniref:OmpW/AlkL family protein n=1 Tax=Agrobacterium vitis TaxID=373 RepID=UPI0012E86693|nr:OmpW family protein [Agrobacterium vitis]MVA80636.1 outer membrane beta-barrel protein [Agrobacterium vitis]